VTHRGEPLAGTDPRVQDLTILFAARFGPSFPDRFAVDGANGGHRHLLGSQNELMIDDLAPNHFTQCLDVIRSLPEWYGYEGALEEVAAALETQQGFVATEGAVVTGFVAIKPCYDESLEITYLAVHADHRRSGVGRSLVGAVADYARERGVSSVCLLTLGPTSGSAHYAETVRFYQAIGFWRTKELYLSSWGNAPTLVMVAPVEQLPS
jgi:ribosomal protein S18 acetylase RimI-like enzyme